MRAEYVEIMDGFYVVKIYVKIRDGLYAVKTTDGLYVVRDIC